MIKKHYSLIIWLVSIAVLGAGDVALASHGGFHALAGIPGIANPDALSTEGYVQALYDISITAAALLVVVKLMLAGVQYMFTEVVTSKEAAKKDIRASLVGLLIILSAVTLLNTINPNLTTLNFLRNAKPATARLEDHRSNMNINPGQSISQNSVTTEGQIAALKASCASNNGVWRDCSDSFFGYQCLFGTNGWYCDAK